MDESFYDESTKPHAKQRDNRPKKGPLLTDAYESVNVEGMFFAGALTHGFDWRKSARHVPTPPLNTEFNSVLKYGLKMRLSPKLTPII